MAPTDSENQGRDPRRSPDPLAANVPGIRAQKSGLAIIGSDFGCGKTVLLAGLAAMLRSNGFAARALKPIVTGRRDQIEAELAFISSITQTAVGSPPIVLDPALGISNGDWQKTVAAGRYFLELSLIELPGSSATPLNFDLTPRNNQASGWKDSADLAKEFARGALLVAKHDLTALEKLAVHSSYLINKGVKLLGLVTVETECEAGVALEKLMGRDSFEISLLARTGVPYLGCLKYSPSVSVPRVNQGNLIKLTTAGLELLDMLKALNLPIPMSS
jgi:dethiobiotin synthetase